MPNKIAPKNVKVIWAKPTVPAHLLTVASPPNAIEGLVVLWRDIGGRLVPIIGQRGFAALYNRSLYASRAEHPFLATANQGGLSTVDYVALQSVMQLQSDEQAEAAICALLETFYERLCYLIGESFTERLLRPIFDTHCIGIALQKASHDHE